MKDYSYAIAQLLAAILCPTCHQPRCVAHSSPFANACKCERRES